MKDPVDVVTLVATLPHSEYEVKDTDNRTREADDHRLAFHNLRPSTTQISLYEAKSKHVRKKKENKMDKLLNQIGSNTWLTTECSIFSENFHVLKRRVFMRHGIYHEREPSYFFEQSESLFTKYGFRDFLIHVIEELQRDNNLSMLSVAPRLKNFVGISAIDLLPISKGYFESIDKRCQARFHVKPSQSLPILNEISMRFWRESEVPYSVPNDRWIFGADEQEVIYFHAPDLYRRCCLGCLKGVRDDLPVTKCGHRFCGGCLKKEFATDERMMANTCPKCNSNLHSFLVDSKVFTDVDFESLKREKIEKDNVDEAKMLQIVTRKKPKK
ncbi:hypothetical protein OROHE_005965 [Orobanche hederae]